MQQFFWAVSQEGDRFTAHYIITWCSQRKHNVENITSCVYNIYCSHIFHIKESYMSWLWKRFGGKLMLFWKTHRQIRWSDCRYRRPGSYNRRTRSQWISPFLMDVGGKKQQQLLRQHDKHISAIDVQLISLCVFMESTGTLWVSNRESLLLNITPGDIFFKCLKNL